MAMRRWRSVGRPQSSSRKLVLSSKTCLVLVDSLFPGPNQCRGLVFVTYRVTLRRPVNKPMWLPDSQLASGSRDPCVCPAFAHRSCLRGSMVRCIYNVHPYIQSYTRSYLPSQSLTRPQREAMACPPTANSTGSRLLNSTTTTYDINPCRCSGTSTSWRSCVTGPCGAFHP